MQLFTAYLVQNAYQHVMRPKKNTHLRKMNLNWLIIRFLFRHDITIKEMEDSSSFNYYYDVNIDITFLLHHSFTVSGVRNSFVIEMNERSESADQNWFLFPIFFSFFFLSKYSHLLIPLKFNHCIYYDFIDYT